LHQAHIQPGVAGTENAEPEREMRIAITADLHLNNSVYGVYDKDMRLPLRTVDALRALEFFVDKSISLKVDRIVVAGDVFDNHTPSNHVRRMFHRQIQKLVASNIQVVILTGNHDCCESHHALLPSVGWSNLIKIVDTPVVESRPDYSCIYVPHTADVQSGKTTFPAVTRGVVKDASKLSHPRILFGHFSVKGAMMNDYKSSDGRSDVSIGDIMSTGADIAFLGHYHKFQRLEADIPVYYVGSLERHNMTDISEDRSIMVYDTVSKEVERIPYTTFRPMKKINVASYAEAMADITSEESWNGYIVKLDFSGGRMEYAEIKSRSSDITREFKARGGAHIHMADVKYAEDHDSDTQVETVDQLDIFSMVDKTVAEDIADPAERAEYIVMFDNLKKSAVAQ